MVANLTSEQQMTFLHTCMQQALNAVQAEQCMPPLLPALSSQLAPTSVRGRVVVIGAGKAAAAMAQSLEQHLPYPISGLVITRDDYGAPCQQIQVLEAAHPVPDMRSAEAAQRMLALLANVRPDDVVIALWSGGGSALLCSPAPCLSLAEKQAIHRALLFSGASIHQMNCVRKHLSAIKGGRLALACGGARIVNFVLSDVPGDDPATVASGPTLPDASTCAEAWSILQKYHIKVSDSVRTYLHSPELEAHAETPKASHPVFAARRHTTHIIASAQTALQAASDYARSQGMQVLILSDRLEGEARELGRQHALLVLQKQTQLKQQTQSTPLLILSGGETTVQVRGTGRGGRNTEYLLSLCLHLQGQSGISALAVDTDGIDGSENNAGASINASTLQRAAEIGMSAQDYLDNNDAYSYFEALGDLIITGATRTNVNDFRAILVLG